MPQILPRRLSARKPVPGCPKRKPVLKCATEVSQDLFHISGIGIDTDKRIYPAIDITKSGTRKDDLLVDKETLSKTYVLRRVINPMGVAEAMEFVLDKLRLTKTNSDFFNSMNQ